LIMSKTKTAKTKLPIQPIEADGHGVIRFRKNLIVEHLLDKGGLDLNDLARLDFPQEDWEQFAQLIGYSVSGFGSLSYVSNDTYETARRMLNGGKCESDARIEYLQALVDATREQLKPLVTNLFRVHEDDLES
jgi:hypothetical protein